MAKININREQIAQYVLKNKKNVIIGGVLFVVGLIVLVALLKLNHSFINQNQGEQIQQQIDSETANAPDPGAVSTYLPDTSRELEDNREIRDPFSRGMILKGIITGGSGGNLAIIESGSTAFVVSPGDEMAGGWTVAEIKPSAIILKMGIHKLQLEFSGRVKDLTPKAAPAKVATDQPEAGGAEAEAEQGKNGAAESVNDSVAAQTSLVPTETSAPASGEATEERTSSQDAQAAKKADNQSSESAGKEGVDE